MTAVALTIAGSDPSGGAGMQADLKTFHQHGVYGAGVVTLLTVQNTQSVAAVHVLEPSFVIAQLDAVLDDIPPQAAKTGALGSARVVAALADRAKDFRFPLVVDPVMISKHGAPLMDDDARDVLRTRLLPHAFLVTPNAHEAEALAGIEVRDSVDLERAAVAIARLGPRNVLIKGGGLSGPAIDLLWTDGQATVFEGPRIPGPNTHGTGCVFSAAITALLARGVVLSDAVRRAKAFVAEAVRTAPGLGRGIGPTNMHAATPADFTPR